jgi:serine/threonine-protein kinase RsbW
MAQVHVPVFPSFGSRPVPSVEMRKSLPSQIAAISPLVDRLMSLIAACRSADGSEADIEIALREALANAVVHGNWEDPEKQVEVVCRCGADGSVDMTIRDQGQGFDSRTIPDPTVPESRMSTHGRGIYLMRAMMDEVRFEDRGTIVHMRKNPNPKTDANSSVIAVKHA